MPPTITNKPMTKEQAEANRIQHAQTVLNQRFGSLVGRTIKDVRPMTRAEMQGLDIESGHADLPFLLILDDGTAVLPSRDAEGNGVGWLELLHPE